MEKETEQGRKRTGDRKYKKDKEQDREDRNKHAKKVIMISKCRKITRTHRIRKRRN